MAHLGDCNTSRTAMWASCGGTLHPRQSSPHRAQTPHSPHLPYRSCTLADMPMLETSGLTKRYGSTVTALDGLTLSLEPGIIGLVGANGAGKSTLLKILLGLIDATSGSAELLGFDVITQGPELRQYVGYMPEH